ncbi:hypothetical protein NVP1253O_45 [Vibrio phage 1.253.O._10N.286.45.B12]|nr:hypothetical protein NVP1235O_45 [Vibrio phage 1.235.O._10N.261.52.B2]AUR98569.1 hypothetical protein NVP1253O_45 [Vibrio phage 1.253.O._10N.286.45.B12]
MNQRQLKKLLGRLESGYLDAMIERHTKAGSKPSTIAKFTDQRTKAEEYKNQLADDASHKAHLDSTRPVRLKAAATKMRNTMANQERPRKKDLNE